MFERPVLFLSAHSDAYWSDLIPCLGVAARAKAIRVGELASLEATARFVLQREAAPQFDLVAACMGAYVALEIYRIAPERLRSLAILSASLRPDTAERRKQREQLISSLSERTRRGEQMTQKDIDLLLPWMVSNASLARPEIVASARSALLIPLAHVLGQQIACRDRNPSLWATAPFVGPAVVAIGRSDRLCSRADADYLSERLGGGPAKVIEGAGHFLPLERPKETAAVLRQALWPAWSSA